MKAELHEAVNEVFRKVADWFQVPQTGFISASVRDLCHIILIELNRPNAVDFSGDAVDTKYTGISVHRLYDCLAVLLQNAHKHGEDHTKISVDVCATRADSDSMLEMVSVAITSTVAEDTYEASKARIYSALDSAEAGTDMVDVNLSTAIVRYWVISAHRDRQQSARSGHYPNHSLNAPPNSDLARRI